MTNRRRASATAAFAVVALVVATPALAQPSPRIPTVTRLVKIFSELETRLLESAHAADASTLDAMLSGVELVRSAGVAPPARS